jgi:hypothetical protein
MHHTARTAPGTGSARPSAAVLAAVVLVLLAALGIAGPPPGTTAEPVAAAVAAAGRHGAGGPCAGDGWDVLRVGGSREGEGCDGVWAHGMRAGEGCDGVGSHGMRADDGCDTVGSHGMRAGDRCDTVCAIRAAIRPEPHSEHPAPRGHLGTSATGTDVTPPIALQLSAPAVHTPSSDPHAPPDRGRAPPATSGI